MPPAVQRALKEVGYGRADIAVEARDVFYVGHPAGEGSRSFFGLVNLQTGQTKFTYGNWGGGEAGDIPQLADADRERRPLPPGMVVINGSEGGNRPVWATLTVHPSMMPALLPAGGELTSQEQSGLNIIGMYISSARKEYFRDARLGAYGPENPIVRSLAQKGMVKITGAGAIQITTKGKNSRTARLARKVLSGLLRDV
jgi:hypothetical protein